MTSSGNRTWVACMLVQLFTHYAIAVFCEYNWDEVNYSSGKEDWKKSYKNNPTIALITLYVKKMEIYLGYISKHNLNYVKKYHFNYSKWRGMALFCSKKFVCIIKSNNVKACWRFLMFYFICLERKTNMNLIKKYIAVKTFVIL